MTALFLINTGLLLRMFADSTPQHTLLPFTRSLIEADTADAAAFPPGMVFLSHDGETTGDLYPIFPGAMQRPTSAADLCRVESTGDVSNLSGMHRAASQPQLSAA